jgi:phosphoribosylaminoimidazole (AIR) synthetase
VLLAPHISYLKPLLPLVEQRAIHAMAHITGGGLTDNVPRVLPDKLDAHVKLGSWPVLPIFKFLYEKGKVERDEMLRVFNMGIGMVLIVGKEHVDRVAKHLGQIDRRSTSSATSSKDRARSSTTRRRRVTHRGSNETRGSVVGPRL